MSTEERAREALKARGVQGAELDLLTEIVMDSYNKQGGIKKIEAARA